MAFWAPACSGACVEPQIVWERRADTSSRIRDEGTIEAKSFCLGEDPEYSQEGRMVVKYLSWGLE